MIEIELYPERYSRTNQKGPMPKIMGVTLDPKSTRKQLKAFTLGKGWRSQEQDVAIIWFAFLKDMEVYS